VDQEIEILFPIFRTFLEMFWPLMVPVKVANPSEKLETLKDDLLPSIVPVA